MLPVFQRNLLRASSGYTDRDSTYLQNNKFYQLYDVTSQMTVIVIVSVMSTSNLSQENLK